MTDYQFKLLGADLSVHRRDTWRGHIMPYALTWTAENKSRKRKVHERLSPAIHEAVTLDTPEIRDEITGTVIREQAIRDIHEIVEAKNTKR